MPSFLLEIGTEELPSGAVAPAVEQLKTALRARLDLERLPVPPDGIDTFATPRRLTLVVADLPERQADAAVAARGPQVKAAFDAEGAPTRAAEGFAQKQGLAVSALVIEGDYVVARRTEPGRPTAQVLADVVPDLLRTITFPKFMRWGAGGYRFGRPLRRFIALLGDEVVPFSVEGVASGRATVGHRYTKEPISLPTASAQRYAEALRAAGVEPDPAARHNQIVTQANRLAEEIGGRAVLDAALIEENVYLTEWVTAVLGRFDPAYLALPRPVLVTAMQKHQRFFPVEGPDGVLLPCFIAIRSGDDAHLDSVRSGYEKVLASRFNDAKFFFDHDRATPLSGKLFKTERIVFQEKLGTLADKTRRLQALMEATGLFDGTADPDAARRAALLAKADLASELVMELPSLQGIMGREYARRDGEPEAVAQALAEQYLPRFAGDALPEGRVGAALAVADRVDTLVGYVRFVGAEPKGSSDPFGLKRAASAVIDLLARDRTLPGVWELVAAATEAYAAQGRSQAEKPGDVAALLAARLRGLLDERGTRYDLIDALLATPWDSVASVVARAEVLTGRMAAETFAPTVQAATRIRRILASASVPDGEIARARLTEPAEKTVLAALDAAQPQVEALLETGDYGPAFDTLAALTEPINRFFEEVLVMAEDPAVRDARLSLLVRADRLYQRLADFSKLVTE